MTFVILLLLYMLVYQLDELVIFLVAVFTLRATRIQEKQGRLLKLGGGMLMLGAGAGDDRRPGDHVDRHRLASRCSSAAMAVSAIVVLVDKLVRPNPA